MSALLHSVVAVALLFALGYTLEADERKLAEAVVKAFEACAAWHDRQCKIFEDKFTGALNGEKSERWIEDHAEFKFHEKAANALRTAVIRGSSEGGGG